MLRTLTKLAEKISFGKVMLATLAFVIMYYIINYSSVGVSALLKITGGANILDFELGYSAQKAYNMLTQLGADGRTFYISRIIPLDFPFPAAYMAFYFAWIAFLLKRIDSNRPLLNLFLLFPVLAMLFDWIENVFIIIMLKQYPSAVQAVYTVGSCVTILKFIFSYASLFVIAVLLVAVIIKMAKTPKKRRITEKSFSEDEECDTDGI